MKKTILGKRIRQLLFWRDFYLLLFLFIFLGIQAQQTETPGKIRVKFTDEMATMLEANPMQNVTAGSINMGMKSLNQIHSQFSAKSYKRVYPHGGKFEQKHRKYGLHLWYEIDIDESQDVKQACTTYMQDSNVILAEPIAAKKRIDYSESNYKASPQSTINGGTNDPLFSEQWHFNNTGQRGENGIGSDISLLKAWEIEAGDADVIVSVHDGGIHVNHEDLINSMWVNEDEIPGNGIDDDNNGYIDDINGYGFGDDTGAIAPDNHGTHVAGTVGATTNNGIGVAGVAGGDGSGNGVRLMSCAVFGGTQNGNFDQSYIYAADNGAVISQNSWGYTIARVFEQSTLDAIRYFIAEAGYDELGNPSGPMQGGIVIFAAGNDDRSDDRFPSAFEEVIAVGSTDFDDVMSGFTNWGDWVDIGAPGNPVFSTAYNERDETLLYDYLSGTSMACPHVSGVAALIVSKFKGNITPEQTRNRLIGSADEVPYTILGNGRLNAFAALQENDNIPPNPITDFTITGTEQNIVSYSWTVPSDQGNGGTLNYEIRYATEPITASNYDNAILIPQYKIASSVGSLETFSSALDVATTYYFAIKAIDIYGNFSDISNIISVTSGNAPLISVSQETVNFNIDVSTGESSQTETITVNNIGNDILNYTTSVYAGFMNQIFPGNDTDPSADLSPSLATTSSVKLETIKKEIQKTETTTNTSLFENNMVVEDSIYYDNGDENFEEYIGSIRSPTAFAVRFEVDKPKFELTHVRNLMDISDVNAEFVPITIEIRKGRSINNSELLLSQEVMPDESERTGFLTVPLMKSQTFVQGDVFWIIHKFRTPYEFPQGVENSATFPSRPNTYFISLDEGATYANDTTFSYITRAISSPMERSNKVVLSTEEGNVSPNNLADFIASYDASNTPNGEYTFSLIIESNDPQQKITRIPSRVTVTGQVPEISVPSQLLEFDITLLKNESEKEIEIGNNGLDTLKIDFSSNNPDFTLADTMVIPPAEKRMIPIKFTPSESGISPGIITLASNDPKTPELEVQVFGIASDPPVIEVAPTFIESSVPIGQTTTEKITIKNTGNFPLTFSMPELALGTSDNSNQELKTDIEFGYSWMDSKDAGGPVYVWNDIKRTGIEINIGDVNDTAIDLPFIFNFYGGDKERVHVHSDGMLYFGDRDEPVRPRSIATRFPFDRDRLNDFIAVYYRDSSEAPVGNIYYKLTENALVVQYEKVGRSFSGEIGLATFQVVLLKSGNILFYYNDMIGVGGADDSVNHTIGIENITGTDGFSIFDNINGFTLDNNLAVMITPKKSDFITDASPITGIIGVGDSLDIDITLDTGNLLGGTYENELLISSNDPSNFYTWVSTTLNVIGEQEQIIVAPEAMVFENTFVNTENSTVFTITNPGTASIVIENIGMDNNLFALDIETPFELGPLEEIEVPVIFAPTAPEVVETALTITTNIPNSDPIVLPLTATSLNAPVVAIDTTTSFDVEAFSGEQVSKSLTIKNEGESSLEYTLGTPAWAYIDEGTDATPSNGADKYGYRWKDNKTDANKVLFDFIDIAQTGINISEDISHAFPGTGSAKIALGFDFPFYENSYNDVWISSRGLLYFGDNQIERNDTQNNRPIPVNDDTNNIIAGVWDEISQSGDTYYQVFDDFFIVQYTNQLFDTDNLDPDSAFTMQIILYANGNIKMQYKDIANNEFISSYTIGIENETGDDGMLVSFNDFFMQNGLAILIEAPEKRSIAPGEIVTLPLVFDAADLNDGEYTEDINITSNDPFNNSIAIPTNFTVFGSATIEVETSAIDFGELILNPDSLEPFSETISIHNIGSNTLLIDNISTDTDEFAVAFDAPISIEPSESTTIDVTSISDSFGLYSGNLLITSNDQENGELSVSIQAKVVDSPTLITTTKNDTIYAKVKLNGIANERITLTNNATLGTLNYSATPDYLQIDSEFINSRNLKSNVILNQVQTREAQYAITDSLFYSPVNNTIDTFGYDNESLIAASKFTVGSKENFELTHVRAYYDPGTSTEAITIKIYTGGTTPNEAQLIYTQEHEPQASANFELIALEEAQNIKAEETFWIAIEYPLSMQRPQGTVFDGVNYFYNTFYYSLDHGASWVLMEFFNSSTQFQIRALGSTYIDWMELSPDQGNITAGTDGDINVLLDATGLDSGTYYADINFTSNDIYNSSSSIPVRMIVNSAPEFYETPINTLQVLENETIEIDLRATDSDGQVVSYTLDENYANVSFESSSEKAKITFSPDYTQSGLYTFTVNAFDDLEDTVATSFTVEVIDNNRAPALVKQIPLQFYSSETKYLDLSNYIQDPDMDELSYTISAIDPTLIDFTTDQDILAGKPLQRGGTYVTIVASDGKNGQVGISFRAISLPPKTPINSLASKNLSESAATTARNFKILNEPNPFQNATTIKYNVETTGFVKLEVYSFNGKLMETLVNQTQEVGDYEILFDRKSMSSGTYIYTIQVDGQIIPKKMIIK